MRKIIGLFIIIVLLIFTGCSSKQTIEHNYTYKGENEFWSAEYMVNGTGTFTEKNGITEYESNCNKTFRITYKKDLSQLSSVKHMELSYESSTGAGKITEDYNDGPPSEKTYTMKSGGKNGAIEKKDEVIKVTINLDGEIQTIELKNVN
ncbi:MAG: hypothetical protein ABRQ27_11720 [Clostridiaceae bacterium]